MPYWLQALAEAVETALVGAGRHDSGAVSVAACGLTSGNVSSAAVVFEAGLFTTAPIVTTTLASVSSGTNFLVPRVGAITATGCTIYVYNVGNATAATTATTAAIGSVTVQWHAIQDDA